LTLAVDIKHVDNQYKKHSDQAVNFGVIAGELAISLLLVLHKQLNVRLEARESRAVRRVCCLLTALKQQS